MLRKNIIKIDLCFLDEETGDFDYRILIDKEFLKIMGKDGEAIAEDLGKVLDKIFDKGDN